MVYTKDDAPSRQLLQHLTRSRALSPSDMQTIIVLADLQEVKFVKLEPKGVVVDDVLTGISGVIHASPESVLSIVKTFLELRETSFTLELTPLGIQSEAGFEVRFFTPEL